MGVHGFDGAAFKYNILELEVRCTNAIAGILVVKLIERWGCMDSTGVLNYGLPAEVPLTSLNKRQNNNR